MRSFEQRIAEIQRRSEKIFRERKQRRRHILMACIPVVLCIGVFSAFFLPAVQSDGATDKTGGVLGENSPENFQPESDDLVADGGMGNTAIAYSARYIRTDCYGCQEDTQYPQVTVIQSVEQMQAYHAGSAPQDPGDEPETSGAVKEPLYGIRYTETFFEENYLLCIVLEEPSGSIRHEVRSVEQSADRKVIAAIDSIVPETGTCDMAQWHIILELSRNAEVAGESDVLVYLDDALVWDGEAVELPEPEAVYKEPPDAALFFPDGEAPLVLGGYSWVYDNGDGTSKATIADQAGRILKKELFSPVSICADHAETVYICQPETGCYEPTNMQGFLVKLDFETAPTTVEYTCWPDTVWDDGNIPQEAVVSHEENAFYAKPGGYLYEIVATWENNGAGYYGTANYYVYIAAGE